MFGRKQFECTLVCFRSRTVWNVAERRAFCFVWEKFYTGKAVVFVQMVVGSEEGLVCVAPPCLTFVVFV